MFKELLKELAVKTAPALVAMAGQAVVGFIAQKTGKTEKPERGSMSGNASPSSPKPSVTPVKEALRSGFTKLWAKIKPDIQAAFADAFEALLTEAEKGIYYVLDEVNLFFTSKLGLA